MRVLLEPPKALVQNGRVRFGTFSGPIADVNLIDADPWRLPVPRIARGLRLKEWQAFQFGNGRHFVSIALFNAKLLALVQLKVYDSLTKSKVLFERKLPGWALTAPRNLLDSRMEWAEPGAYIRFVNRLARQRVELEVDLPATADTPSIVGRLVASSEGAEPQVVSIPFAENRGMYSHKACLGVTGDLRVGNDTLAFTPSNGILFVDDHKGYYPRIMRWDWVVGGGFDARGRRIGLNLTRNDSIDPPRYNENCVWIDGRAHLLPPVSFRRFRERVPQVWEVRDAVGDVAIDFEVSLPGPLHLNALIIESRYDGPFGRLRGSVRGPNDERITLDGMLGLGEDFYLKA